MPGNMIEVAKATVTIVPNMQGAQKEITAGMTGAATTAGNSAGKAAGSAMAASIGSSMTKAGKAMTVGITTPLVAAGTASVAAAAQFDTSFSKLQTIADTTSVSVEDLKSQIKELSNQTGMSASEVAEAAYSAISAGQSTGDALNFVATSAKLAKGGFTDVATATDVLTTALNAYGLASSDATHVSDVLISTQNLGKTTVDELATSMGKVIPTAAAAGVGIEDLASQYVALTKNGIATAESTTYINSMLNELTKSGTTANLAFEAAAGQSFPEYIAAGHSTAEAMQLLGKYAEENGFKINDMFGSAEAAKAANVLAAHTSDATEAIKEMTTQTGQTQAAFETMDATSEAAMQRMKTSLQNTMISLGDAILPVLTPLTEGLSKAIGGISDAFSSLPKGTQSAILGIAGVAAAAGPVVSIGGKLVSGFSKVAGHFANIGGSAASAAGGLTSVGSSAASAASGAASAASGFGAMAGGALQIVAIGASFALVGVGLKLIAEGAVAIGQGGLPAAAALLEMVAAVTAFMGVAALLGPALTAGAVGIGVFGAAVLAIGGGIALASAGVSMLADAFGDLIERTAASADGLNSIISTISGGFVDTINAVAGVIDTALGGVAGIFDSIGGAALNSGKGMLTFAQGIEKIVGLNLVDLAASMVAVGAALKNITKESSGLSALGTGMSTFVSSLTQATPAFNNYQKAATSAMTAAKNAVTQNLETMKKAFASTKFEFGAIKVPHFSMSGAFDAESGSVPEISVEWYAKAAERGALFTSPQLIGVGDASQPEMLVGERTLYDNIAQAVSESGGGDVYVYIGEQQLDAIIQRSQKRTTLRSGGH